MRRAPFGRLLRTKSRYHAAHFSVSSSGHDFERPSLCGQCSCGKSGFRALGVSAANFISHSSAPRHAQGGKSFLRASGFRPDQITWWSERDGVGLVESCDPVEAGILSSLEAPELQPPGSKNAHFFCGACEEGEYLGVEANRWLGVTALNLDRCQEVMDAYQPNFHTFYSDRVEDVNDGLPKWKTVPQGELLHEEGTEVTSTTQPAEGDQSGGEWVTGEGRGRLRKNVLPLSPVTGPEPLEYHFTEATTPPSHS